jgi:hypothetical protein
LSGKEQNSMASSARPLRHAPSRRNKSRAVPPTLLLVSHDQALAELVGQVVRSPWVVEHISGHLPTKDGLGNRNVRLIVLDDDGLDESNRGWLLHHAERQIPHPSVLYIAGVHTDSVERLARAGGAQFYISKPLPLDRFGYVLGSFLKLSK